MIVYPNGVTTVVPPRDIRLFETVQLVSIAMAVLFSKDGSLDMIFTTGLLLVLTLLVSRGHRNWARWVLTIMFVLGVALLIWVAPLLISQGRLAITITATVIQAIGVSLLFTKQSDTWLRRAMPK